ncbi:hypothetical protein Cfor_00020 [Coptotermes formosanus]|uniref:DRBM domain-containing protein n=1 Tax=Coptotermes formosanus TaxID=36987 RepID=A0A6L2PDL3_COPFO|nr:hypothetical protein Cfor_00020 [Coptotermes formosanus]
MDDSSVHVKSEDTSPSVDLPPLEDEADSADDVDFDEAIIPTIVNKKSAEILIEIDEDRKKVIRLNDGGYDSLVELFFEAVADDPGLKEYANSTFVFQIFNQKFNTWVDLDRSTELIDGSHLKAIFLTQTEHTESRHKHRKSSKRRLADSSDKCSDDNCKSKIFCSSEDSIRAKRICQPIKASETDVEKNSVTTSLSVRNHDLVDFVNNSSKKQVSESHSVSPVSQGELYNLSLGLSDKNPISALHELCTKLHWEKPVFEIHEQDVSLPNAKFLMKVTVRGQTYIPDKCERRKQLAKAAAAEYCLKQLGVFK